MSNINKKILEKIVDYNKKVIEKHGNNENKAINEMITLKFEGHSIWNPFLDESGRFKVEPEKKYGKEEIDMFINKYNEMNKEN
ncbi:hypothetical protein SAMN04488598_1556 [Halanaerobium congolense]|jgi:hypothetical protein|uniref:Uncharacterized protein n=1 Tax=Halanaerobium congolense TaxID=54121 RepID=A0A1I0CDX2_9FIRM|nr:hypothetical protein [Halanaerobium congolense]PTX14806.1 hypothetical protein C7953_2871 [Halanaerobium congolense]SDG16942.1 hypothetical protein SAMN04488598_1556 [Halanaerobium congolense]SET17770.1 hypothetical protein SAMN04515652_1357 [Halanaerobium congolense]SFP67746.1 hypothetical protein SAMN04488596_1397 [Halanaerobium congolense]